MNRTVHDLRAGADLLESRIAALVAVDIRYGDAACAIDDVLRGVRALASRAAAEGVKSTRMQALAEQIREFATGIEQQIGAHEILKAATQALANVHATRTTADVVTEGTMTFDEAVATLRAETARR